MKRIKMKRLKPRDFENDGLPQGVNREPSPFWDFHSAPARMMGHILRYSHLTQMVKEITDWPRAEGTIRVLDVGCGNAEMYPWIGSLIRPKGGRWAYTGLDLDDEKLKQIPDLLGQHANMKLMKCNLLEGVKSLNLEPHNIAICAEVLEHLTPEGCHILCKSLRRVVPDFIGTVPSPDLARRVPYHINEMYRDGVREMLERAGWKVKFLGHLNVRWDGSCHPYMSKDVFRQFIGMKENLVGVAKPKYEGKLTIFHATVE